MSVDGTRIERVDDLQRLMVEELIGTAVACACCAPDG